MVQERDWLVGRAWWWNTVRLGKIFSGIRWRTLAIGNAPSFGKRTVCAFEGKFSGMRGDVARYKEGTSWWRIRDGHWCRGINLDIKCCTCSRPGVVLGQGYKYKPLMSVIGIEPLHNKTGPVPKSSPLVESSSSSRGAIDPSTSVSTGNLVSCLVSCGGFRPWCKKSCHHA
jgi:hypothetical protein